MSTCVEETAFSKTKETTRIVIIGAGASGIAAATKLLEQGFKNVQLFEAEDRIGGRINTVTFGNSFVDLGAQWCHGEEGNVVYEKVKDLDVLDRPGEYTIYFVRSNKEILSNEQTNVFKEFMGKFDVNPDCEGSVGDALTESYWKEMNTQSILNDKSIIKEALDFLKRRICSENACDSVSELSPRNYLNFQESGGDQNLSWRQKGYKKFLSVLLKSNEDQPGDHGILKGKVHLNRRIAEINWSGNGEITLRCWNGQIFSADHVICTVSLGVLKEKHPKLFVPALPADKVSSIKGLKLGTVNKFFLEFEVQPLPEKMMGIACLWLEEDLKELRGSKFFWLESICGFHRVDRQPLLLEGWIIGAHARYIETLSEEKVLEGLLWLFRKFLSFSVPYPKSFLRSQWHSNPNFRGSYSCYPTYADELRTGRTDLGSPLVDVSGRPRVQFAGEAKSRTHFSTVHGATETGWREADRLNEFYKGRAEN
ncbi:spermine oxidase-like [Drosophila ficusphila]|uniref:spermine oxidase-like n=1 Tax=Drosophila ficusphila TaxID=30025 RepID=UPI0007E8368C|nr:spermine oxidase-like [Drosophila ficusphila]